MNSPPDRDLAVSVEPLSEARDDGSALPDRAALREAELRAARRTIEVLIRRIERLNVPIDPGGFALRKAIAGLENRVRDRTRALSVSEAHYRALYDLCPDAILTIDKNCRILACNHTAARTFRRSVDELVGTPVSSLLDVASGAALTGLLWAGFTGVGESDVVLDDGRHMSFSVARLSNGQSMLVLRDVSRAFRFDQELRKSRSLASVCALAAKVANEINNPLAVIQGRVELLQSALPGLDPDQLQQQLAVIRDHCERIGRIARNLHGFAIPADPRPERVPVRRVIADAVRSAGRHLERVEVSTRIVPSRLTVWADRDQLRQVLVNLLVLAAENSPRGRTVQVEASAVGEDEVRFTVTDEGPGMPEKTIEELSARPPDDLAIDPTMGLGLAIVSVVVHENGGRLRGFNHKPHGRTFEVMLPARADASPGEPADEARPISIMVVDDDQLLCETVKWMLDDAQHRIVTVHSAEAALKLLGRERFDVVLTDYRLPGMDGRALIEAIGKRWPDLVGRTILTSGVLSNAPQGATYLPKPFTREQLIASIRAVAGA